MLPTDGCLHLLISNGKLYKFSGIMKALKPFINRIKADRFRVLFNLLTETPLYLKGYKSSVWKERDELNVRLGLKMCSRQV